MSYKKPTSVGARTGAVTNARGRTTTRPGQTQRNISPQRKPTTVPGTKTRQPRARVGRMDPDYASPGYARSQQHQNPDGSFRDDDGQAGAESTPQQSEYRGSYTMIPPNQRKREQIQRQAEKETKQYEQYKERNKMGYISLPPQTVGGGEVSSKSNARQQQAVQHRQITATRQGFGAKGSYKASVREKEEAEAREKKANARLQTERNREKEIERKRDLDEDRRKKNEEFLRRFEKTGKRPQNASSSSSSAPPAAEPPEKTTKSPPRASYPRSSGHYTYSDQTYVDPDIQILQEMFPDKSTDELSEALTTSYGNIDMAANQLMGI